MPISPIVLQRRHAELGRIRLGAKRGGNGAPMKLEQFRFTTHSERYARDLAELYGGEAKPWDNNAVASWEVFTDAKSIPVIAVKGGLTQWMETWSGGGCAHRCDGEKQADGTYCDPEDRNHINAKPTTRLSVMLPELEAIGVWRMESHGWNAAAEIPAVAELAQFVGDLVPANLHLVERRAIKDGKTSRFVVPVLDLQIGTARLKEIVAQKSGSPTPELAAPASSAPAIEAARPDYRGDADIAMNLDEVRAIWKTAAAAGHLDAELQAYLTERGNALQAPADPASKPDADGVVDAELVEDPPITSTPGDVDADAIWNQILKAGGERGMTLPDVEDDVRTFLGGMSSAEASGAELAEYLTDLLGRDTEAGAA